MPIASCWVRSSWQPSGRGFSSGGGSGGDRERGAANYLRSGENELPQGDAGASSEWLGERGTASGRV